MSCDYFQQARSLNGKGMLQWYMDMLSSIQAISSTHRISAAVTQSPVTSVFKNYTKLSTSRYVSRPGEMDGAQ